MLLAQTAHAAANNQEYTSHIRYLLQLGRSPTLKVITSSVARFAIYMVIGSQHVVALHW
jgi:hypothetical protein